MLNKILDFVNVIISKILLTLVLIVTIAMIIASIKNK